MGVPKLLPELKSVTDQVHVSKYAGKTVGVDASGWLYKGAYSCRVDLVRGRDTDAYLNFTLQQLKLLQEHNITPILVFDGAPLPAKSQTNLARAKSRAKFREKAQQLLQQQQDADSRELFTTCTRAVSVTNEMVRKLMDVLRRMDVTFYVAPYEADAQLAFLSRHKMVDVVISDDSDCLPYGCKTVLFKLTQDGWGSELKRRSLGANEELSFVGWTEEMFVQMCVLAGCDYCPSVPGVGIRIAHKLVDQYKIMSKVLAALQSKYEVPNNFAEQFYSSILTYRHHLVFDPRDAKLKMLSPLDISTDILPHVDIGLNFLGNVELRDDVVASIASGLVDPKTLESYAWKDTAAAVLQEEEQNANAKITGLPSMTSSESSGVAVPHQHTVPRIATDARDLPEDDGSSLDRESDTPADQWRSMPSQIRYEKPRPSSRSSWTHLDSVLGSSDHIVNFRSPKVSENFTPLAALAQTPVGTTNITAQDLKELESRPVRSHVKRVRNPTHRRRDGKGSGFEGEVLCKVDASTSYDHQPSRRTPNNDIDSKADAENAPPPQVKRPKLFERASSPRSSSSLSNVDKNPPVRPTPFGCGQSRPPASLTFNWTSLGIDTQPYQRNVQPSGTQTSSFAIATYAEEKWDRILRDEIDAGSNDSQEGDKRTDNSAISANTSNSSHRQPLAPINKQ